MNPLDQINLLTESEDVYISGAAKSIVRAKISFDEGSITQSEYLDLLESLNRTRAISEEANALETAVLLNKAINALIAVVRAV